MSNLRRRVAALVVMGVLFGCSWATARGQIQPQPAADFGFRFEVGDCLTEKFDTFAAEFTKDIGGDPPQSVNARFSLTESQMRAIYQTIERVRFFDLSSPFDGVPPGLLYVRMFAPANTYRLEVRNGGVMHAVSWKDAYKPTTEEADRLRALFSMIIGFIHDHPDFKRLPRPSGACL